MRHGNKNKKLGRTMEHREAMFANLSNSLIEHKRIHTTLQKAKALRGYFEPLVTRAKDNSTHNRRIVFSALQNKEAVKELFGPIAAAVGDRPGGYVRIIRTGYRHGDAADMAMIELVDFNTDYNGQSKAEESKGKKRRTRRSGGSSKAAAPAPAKATKSEEVNVEAVPVAEAVVEIAEADMVATGEIAEEAANSVEEATEEAADEATQKKDEE
ncbi:MAG: 50S ribosomal protein L17 [Bacteroidetes bacterium]|nr:50S ribosomal protein L17 [Bacteroidota bacterium]